MTNQLLKQTPVRRVLLLAFIFHCVLQSHAKDFTYNGLTYTSLTDNTCETKQGSPYSHNAGNSVSEYNIIIPETAYDSDGKSYTVTQIGAYGFYGCSSLEYVSIPNSVTSIGEEAFLCCYNLEDISIPNSVTSIGDRAFSGSGLTSVTLPNSVTSIGEETFLNCSELTSIKIPSSVTSIGDAAFQNCSGLTSVTLPNSVTSIGKWAFRNCDGLISFSIPSSVSSIGESAFTECGSMQNFIVDSNNEYFATDETGALYNKDFSTLVVCPGSKTEFNIPNSVTSIGYAAFWGCAGLSSVTIPNTVTSIGDFSFEKCAKLTSVVIPSSVKTIGGYAFLYCIGLTSIDIPNSVVSIGDFSFGNCTSLTSVTIPNSLAKIGDSYLPNCGNYAFSGCESITSLTFEDGEGNLSFGYSVFDGVKPTEVYFGRQMDFTVVTRTYLEAVEFGENVTSIADKAFSSAKSLRSVTANSAVPPTIGEATFADDTYKSGTLYVKNDAIDSYKAATGWKNFSKIDLLEDAGISEISKDTSEQLNVDGCTISVNSASQVRIVALRGTTVYSGHGNCSVNVTPGIYVVIVGNKAHKVAVR